MTPEQRIAELEAQRADALAAENARLRALLEAMAADHARALVLLEDEVAELRAAIAAPSAPQAADARACRMLLPPRRCRPGGRRAW